jgi:hypothetical protein
VPNIMQAEPVLCWLSSLRARYGIPNENNKSTPTMLRISTMCSNRLPTCLLLASYGKTSSVLILDCAKRRGNEISRQRAPTAGDATSKRFSYAVRRNNSPSVDFVKLDQYRAGRGLQGPADLSFQGRHRAPEIIRNVAGSRLKARRCYVGAPKNGGLH